MIIRETSPRADVAAYSFGFMEMSTDQNIPEKAASSSQPSDLLSRLYREIGISAVAAALEATARKPQKSAPSRKDILAVLRDGEAA
jgi:hypothetical protein